MSDLEHALDLIRTSSRRWETLKLDGHEWRHDEKFRAAWKRHMDGFGARGSAIAHSMEFTNLDHGEPELESLESWRLWLAKPDKKRAQFKVGHNTVTAVFIGQRWWSWSPDGSLTNDGRLNSTHGLGPGEGLVDAGRHLGSLRLQFDGNTTFLSRSALLVTAHPRVADQNDFGLTIHLLGTGADLYRFVIDAEIGLLLRCQAELRGEAFRVIEVDDIGVNQPLSEATFDPDRLSSGITHL